MRAVAAALAAATALALPTLGTGAVYWGHGVRAKNVTVCFVGDALTSRAARVTQVLTYIEEFEYAANVRFVSLGTCPASVVRANGNDWFYGDIRVLLPGVGGATTPGWSQGTGPIPGKGCPAFLDAKGSYNHDNDDWKSWSNAPDDLKKNRACLYNLKLGDDAPASGVPYLNHTLHEFGHALGLAHEHERMDVDPSCTAKGYGGGLSSGFMTPYDRSSVMHYQFLSCGIDGNYADTGLSAWDQLAFHILYPESRRPAEYVGTTVVRTNDEITLQAAWEARGANMSFVAGDFLWTIDGAIVSTTPDLATTIDSPGDYELDLTYTDFVGRTYSQRSVLHVLAPDDYAAEVAGPAAALSVLA